MKKIAEYDLHTVVVSAGINSSRFIIMGSLVQKASWFFFEDLDATANYGYGAVRSRCRR